VPKQANNVGDSEADGQEVGIAAAKPVVREYAFAQAHVKGLCIREVNGATGIGKSYIFRYRLLVARNIRRIRVARGLSQEALVVDAEIDRTYVSRLERNLENPTVGVLERVAKALRCQIVDLFVPSGSGLVATLRPGRKRRANNGRC
jgi:DNA-binding XRE family transcriptional regulator